LILERGFTRERGADRRYAAAQAASRLDAAGLSVIMGDFAETIAAHKGKALADMSGVNGVASLVPHMLVYRFAPRGEKRRTKAKSVVLPQVKRRWA
jgi:hypothetical protein